MNTTGGNEKKLIGWGLSFVVPALMMFIPISSIFTHNLKLFLIITLFVILLIAFELLPMIASAILMPALYIISGIVTPVIAFSSWTSMTVWMILGGLVLSNILDDCGLLKRVAYFVIRKCGGTYCGVVYGCFFIGILLNLITFCNGWLVASGLVFGICKAMDLKPSRESSLICFAGTIGATGSIEFLYNPGYVTIIETSLRKFIPEYTMSIFTPFIYNGFFGVWCLLTIYILMKVYKIDENTMNFKKEIFEENYKKLGKISIKEKKAIIIIALLFIYLLTAVVIGIPIAYGFMIIPYLMLLPGVEIASSKALEKINFPMLFFVSACLGIGIVGAEVGFGDFLTNIAVPILSGKSTLLACVAFMFLGMIANFFMTPYAMLGGLSIPFAQIAISLGINPVVGSMILLYTCDMVFLPYQSAGNLMMYGYGLMPMKDFVKQQGLKSVIMFIGFIVVMYPLWNLFGLIN